MAKMLVEYGEGRDSFLKHAVSIGMMAVVVGEADTTPIRSLLTLAEKVAEASDGETIDLTREEATAYHAALSAAKAMAGKV